MSKVTGLTLGDITGYEEDVRDFIKRYCLLKDDTITNIISVGQGVSVYFEDVPDDVINAIKFPHLKVVSPEILKVLDANNRVIYTSEGDPVNVFDGIPIVTSVVNFKVEIPYGHGVIVLYPSQFIYIDIKDISYFKQFEDFGLVCVR